MRTKIILPDSSPLFSFVAIPAGLDLLLAPGPPIVLTDYIEWEATRSGSHTAQAIRAWIDTHRDVISVVETELGQVRIARERAGIASKKERRNIGETTIFEAVPKAMSVRVRSCSCSRRISLSTQASTDATRSTQ
jgi:hypothetical protein